jgi:hypothetical protein
VISANDGIATLSIAHTRASDAGLYRCIAHNPYGRERSTAFVYVECVGSKGSSDRYQLEPNGHVGRGRSLPPLPRALAAPGVEKEHPLTSVAESEMHMYSQEYSMSSEAPGFLKVVRPLPKRVEIDEGDALNLVCIITSNIHYIRKWKSARF